MIAKIIPIKTVRKSNYSALIQYLIDPQDKSERISQIKVSNCYSDDQTAALIEIQNTQEMNTRARSDKTCHLVLSFPEGERLSLSDLNAIEERFCDGLGFTGHQRFSVVHDDTNNLHTHVAINKIHPRALTIHNPYYDFIKVAKLCEQIEQEYGLTTVNHETVKDQASRVGHEIETRTGVESLLSWIKREALTETKHANNWQELHQVLARHGLAIKERGNGFVLVANNGVAVKASSVDRSLSKGYLTQRLGAFIPNEHSDQSLRSDIKQYQPRPLHNRIDTSRLYARYQQEQADSVRQRTTQWAMLRHTRDQLIERAKREAKLKRNLIKSIKAGRLAKKALYATAHQQFKTTIEVIRSDYQKAYQHSKASHSRKGWLDWLAFEAKNGNAEALVVLRSRRTGQFKGNQVSTKQSHDGFSADGHFKDGFIKDNFVESITKIGTVTYKAGSTTIRDDGNRLIVLPDTSREALVNILQVAVKKYGSHLAINGTESFRLEIAQVAAQNKMRVTFDDKRLEQYRQQLMKQHRVNKAQSVGQKRSATSTPRRSL
ncbi:relaxase/Mobilisation nuclease domain-containing protein [Nitrosomonas sp. PY1]|uniref:TraI/MobA(P) family conjugative relaxase n=1 Tax=Nitrosomonas sp. PY1 TaxID=1803906 RepID=UPI001FC8D3A8|nr:TraI/MobA(P) family conjugative relaxase [Nitrosomonas sp. PY1]GKS70576.1 relaxase/Mobilisation nuclease domain-containing protein [Nitrosomonas sp. PY1]